MKTPEESSYTITPDDSTLTDK